MIFPPSLLPSPIFVSVYHHYHHHHPAYRPSERNTRQRKERDLTIKECILKFFHILKRGGKEKKTKESDKRRRREEKEENEAPSTLKKGVKRERKSCGCHPPPFTNLEKKSCVCLCLSVCVRKKQEREKDIILCRRIKTRNSPPKAERTEKKKYTASQARSKS